MEVMFTRHLEPIVECVHPCQVLFMLWGASMGPKYVEQPLVTQRYDQSPCPKGTPPTHLTARDFVSETIVQSSGGN